MNNVALALYPNAAECQKMISDLTNSGMELVIVDADGEADVSLSGIERPIVFLSYFARGLQDGLSSPAAILDVLDMLGEDSLCIVSQKYAACLIEEFPLTFVVQESAGAIRNPCRLEPRDTLYYYKNRTQFEALWRYVEEAGDGWYLFSGPLDQNRADDFAAVLQNTRNRIIIDVSNVDPSKMTPFYPITRLSNNIWLIASFQSAQAIYDGNPILFESLSNIAELLPGINEDGEGDAAQRRRIVDLDDVEIEDVCSAFKKSLAGHRDFKTVFVERLKNFKKANPLGEQRIMSVFLFGPTGIGKTETARKLNELLGGEAAKLAKINFGNYSSQDSLNSLIGSPAGYIGCEGGELNRKVDVSKTGVLLLDEFEKTTDVVQAFFLELLEEGCYTDRMGEEHDLSGFVAIFTSNIKDEQQFEREITPELRSRFDLVCEFVEPTVAEKREHLKSYIASKIKKYAFLGYSIDRDRLECSDILQKDLSSLSIREIDRAARQALIECSYISEESSK